MSNMYNVSVRLNEEDNKMLEEMLTRLNSRTVGKVTKADILRTALKEFMARELTADKQNKKK
ncbi:hypothetical protein [Bacillus sp. Bos-x628]|uniref:hypothetical protein n=1 Tax=Bacillus maqinnsis TaxID=3229854 RepID=UPI00338DAAF3